MPLVRLIVFGIAKTLSKLFGLATVAFFGRMPSRDDDKMALVGLLSISWLPVVVAIFVPDLAETLIPYAPDSDAALRGIALTTAIAIPFVVGFTVSRMHNHDGDGGRHTPTELVKGWWYTPVVGLTVVAVVIAVPIVKVSHLVRRYEIRRLMVMIPEGEYDRVHAHLCHVLEDRGVVAEDHDANPVLRFLFRSLGFVLGHIFRRDVADEMRSIRGTDADGEAYEVTLHTADLSIVGHKKQASRVYAVLAEGIDERVVYLTWDDASQDLEDRMRVQRQRLEDEGSADRDEIEQLSEDLATLQLDQEEWDALRRNLYRLERDAARADADAAADEADADPARQAVPAGGADGG